MARRTRSGPGVVIRVLFVLLVVFGVIPAARGAIDSVVPPAASVMQGSSTSVSVGVEPKAGVSQIVAIGAPSGVSIGFSPATVSGPATVVMSVSVASGVPPGTYVITIREMANESVADEASWQLTVTAAATTTSPPESTTTVPSESTTTVPSESTTTVPLESTTTTGRESTTTAPQESTSTSANESTTTIQQRADESEISDTTVAVPPTELSSVTSASDEEFPGYLWLLGGLVGAVGLVLGVLWLLRRRCRRPWTSAIDLLFSEISIRLPSQVIMSGPVLSGSVIRQQLVEGDPVELAVGPDASSPMVFMIDDEPDAWLLGRVRYGWLDVDSEVVEVVTGVNPMAVFPGDGSAPSPFHRTCSLRRGGVEVILGEGDFRLGSPTDELPGDATVPEPSESVLVDWRPPTCGPDVTNALIAAQKGLYRKWQGLSAKEARAACSGLTQWTPGQRSAPAFVNAWEIEEMGPGGVLRDGEYAKEKPPCGGDVCRATVEVNGHCYLAEEVNYIAFGWMTRLCGWSKAAMKLKVRQWKALYLAQLYAKYVASLPKALHWKKEEREARLFVLHVKWGQRVGREEHINKYALAWAVAGWNRAPLHPEAKMPNSSSQQACKCNCPYAWPYPLQIYWENVGTIVGPDPQKLLPLPLKGKGRKHYFHPSQTKPKGGKAEKGSHDTT